MAGRTGSALDLPELASIAERIRLQIRMTTSAIVALSPNLSKARKKILPVGPSEWLASEFDWTERTSKNDINAARECGDRPEAVSDLSPPTIYQRSAPSTAESVSSELVDRETG